MLGSVDWPWLAMVVVLQILNSLIAAMLCRGYAANPSRQSRWLLRLVGFQALVGTGWGAMPWLLWVMIALAG